MYKGKCTVIIPAHNEESAIANCCVQLSASPRVAQLIVVANACSDMTASHARASGALTIETPQKGKGLAVKMGLKRATEEVVVLVDGDLKNPSATIVESLLQGLTSEKVVLVKGYFDRSALPGPVTDMLVKPALKSTNHPARHIRQPLSGMVALRRCYLENSVLPNDFGLELAMLLSAYEHGGKVTEVQLPKIEHRTRPWSHYENMALEVAKILVRFGVLQKHKERE